MIVDGHKSCCFNLGIKGGIEKRRLHVRGRQCSNCKIQFACRVLKLIVSYTITCVHTSNHTIKDFEWKFPSESEHGPLSKMKEYFVRGEWYDSVKPSRELVFHTV